MRREQGKVMHSFPELVGEGERQPVKGIGEFKEPYGAHLLFCCTWLLGVYSASFG